MSRDLFLYKENNTEDRDCVNYIDIERLGKLECGHYFPSLNLQGACFSGGFNPVVFEKITTCLTQDEFLKLHKYSKDIDALGFGIKEGDERYLRGINLFKDIKPILEKLSSTKNEKIFEQVQEEEKEYIQNEYNLDDSEMEYIFDNYCLGYRDRGIICCIYRDIKEVAYEEANSEEERYLELADGRVVVLSY